MKQILSVLLVLARLILPQGSLAKEDGSADTAISYEITISSSLAKELGPEYEGLEALLDGMRIYGDVLSTQDAVQQNAVFNVRGIDLLTLALALDGETLYASSNAVGNRVLAATYKQIGLLVQETYGIEAINTVCTALLTPYLPMVMDWASEKRIADIDETDVSTEQHPDAVKKETLHLGAENLLELLDAFYAEIQEDEALLEAFAAEGQTLENARAEIDALHANAVARLSTLQSFDLMTLHDQDEVLLCYELTVDTLQDEEISQCEITYHQMDVEGARQKTMDVVVIKGEDIARAYVTLEQETLVDTETACVANTRLLLGMDSMLDGKSNSARVEAYLEQAEVYGEKTEFQFDAALTVGGAMYEEMFSALGFEQLHTLFLTGNGQSQETEDGFVSEVVFELAMDEQRIPLLAVNAVFERAQGIELLSLADAIDLFELSDDESKALLIEVLSDAAVVLAEYESLFPEAVDSDGVG